MPMIRIEFDDLKVENEKVQALSEAVQKIVSEVTKIEDVFVYANSALIKVKVAPIEVFVSISKYKVADLDQLMNGIKNRLSSWKKENSFQYPINLTVIPMEWKFEIDI